MENNTQNASFQDFDQMMEQKFQSFSQPAPTGASATNERLQEMNKKLPAWSLEPPHSFLR